MDEAPMPANEIVTMSESGGLRIDFRLAEEVVANPKSDPTLLACARLVLAARDGTLGKPRSDVGSTP